MMSQLKSGGIFMRVCGTMQWVMKSWYNAEKVFTSNIYVYSLNLNSHCIDCPQHTLIGDGYCNDETNNPGCSFDGGDCCGPCINTDFCINCSCLSNVIGSAAVPNALIGNGYCNDELNTPGCNFDGGDCCDHCELITVSLNISEFLQSNINGYYSKSSLINGKPSWISASSKAIWYIQEYDEWAIGSLENIGTLYLSFYSEKVTFECAFNLRSEKWWYVYEGVWHNAVGNEIMVKCLKGKSFK